MGVSYPQQLKSTDLTDLIAAAQADEHDDSAAMNEIIRRFDGKAQQIAYAVCLRDSDHDDVANAARLALVRAVRLHQAQRRGFIVYATIHMTGAARRESQRLTRPQEVRLPSPDIVRLDDRTPMALSLVSDSADDNLGWGSGPVAEVIADMPPDQQVLLSERYIADLDLAEIARLHGSSVSAVSQRLKTAHRHIHSMLPSVALCPAAD